MDNCGIKVATTERELRQLTTGWKSLQRRVRNASTVFQTWEWGYAWWRAFCECYDSLAVFYTEGNGQITALAPLVIAPTGTGKVEAILLGSGESDYLDCLVLPEQQLSFGDALVHGLRQMSVPTLLLTDLPPWSRIRDSLATVARSHELHTESGISEVCPFIDLPPEWPIYLASRSRNMRASINRAQQRLAKRGVSYCVCETRTELRQYQDTFLELHQDWWAHKNAKSVLSNPGIWDFLLDATERLFAENLLHISVQMDRDTAISSYISFVQDRTFYYYLSGINPSYRTCSPGLAHLGALVDGAIRSGSVRFDLLRGEEEYKSRWSTGHNQTSWYRLELS